MLFLPGSHPYSLPARDQYLLYTLITPALYIPPQTLRQQTVSWSQTPAITTYNHHFPKPNFTRCIQMQLKSLPYCPLFSCCSPHLECLPFPLSTLHTNSYLYIKTQLKPLSFPWILLWVWQNLWTLHGIMFLNTSNKYRGHRGNHDAEV